MPLRPALQSGGIIVSPAVIRLSQAPTPTRSWGLVLYTAASAGALEPFDSLFAALAARGLGRALLLVV